jgi:hypothetical protein
MSSPESGFEPMTLRLLVGSGAKVEENRIRTAAAEWISRRQPVPIEAWGTDPIDQVIVGAIDRVWAVRLLGAEPNRLHPSDEVAVFTAAFESVPHEDKLEELLKECDVKENYSWDILSAILSEPEMQLLEFVRLLGSEKDYGMPLHISSVPGGKFESQEEQDRWFMWMRRVLWRRQCKHQTYYEEDYEWGDDPERLFAAEIVSRAIQEVLPLAPGNAGSVDFLPGDAFFGPIYWYRSNQDVEKIMARISQGLDLNASGQGLTERWPEWEQSTLGQFVDDLLAIKRRAT